MYLSGVIFDLLVKPTISMFRDCFTEGISQVWQRFVRAINKLGSTEKILFN